MRLAHRLAYFSGGFIIGIILLIVILSGKKTSCAYGIQARTLKHIRVKEKIYSEESLEFFKMHHIDTSLVNDFLEHGRVDFSQSNVPIDSCKQYIVNGTIEEHALRIKFANCEETARVLTASFQDEN